MPEITVNTTDYELRRAREGLLGWAGALDAKRPRAWDQYGYPERVGPEQLRMAYERNGAGHGAVHRILDKCWQERPRIKIEGAEEESPWEKKVAKLFKGLRLWSKLRDLDRRNMVGRYAALIYRVADSQRLDQPLVKAAKLVDVKPLFETQIKVTKWHADPADAENYGKPAMFQYQTRDLTQSSDTQGRPDQWADVHPSRVQILAEGSVGDFFDGVPLLLAGFNHLVDLEKISGGSAESYLKNSARTLQIKFDASASPQAITTNPDGTSTGKTVAEIIEEKTGLLNRNIDASIVLQGGEASTLQTQQTDPLPPFEVAANLFAASVRLPFTILFGQQTGRLASDQDQKDYSARCQSRQIHELTPMIEEFVQRMQACGVIDQAEFEVEWPPLDTPGDVEKFAIAEKMSTINQRAFQSGQGAVYAGIEIRKATGYDEAVPDDPVPGDPAMGEGGDPTDPGDPAQQQTQQRPRVVAAR